MHTLFSLHQRRRVCCCFGVFLLLALSTLLTACGADTTQLAAVGQGTTCPSTSALQGAGSTFDAPLFSKMFAAYAKVSCGLDVSYLADGSSAGINNLLVLYSSKGL